MRYKSLEEIPKIELSIIQKIFVRTFCYPPPGRVATEDVECSEVLHGALDIYIKEFGDNFMEDVRDNIIIDIGCGCGDQVLALAQKKAKLSIGIEIKKEFLKIATDRAIAYGLKDNVIFTSDQMENMKAESVDIVLSCNAFEHFHEPGNILSGASHVLKQGGKFYITFSPPWLHPYGAHMFFMIKYPWAHLIFSEKTIMKARMLYTDDRIERYENLIAGLNKMTIRKFIGLVKQSSFTFEKLINRPIRPLPAFLACIPGVREYLTSRVCAVLKKQ